MCLAGTGTKSDVRIASLLPRGHAQGARLHPEPIQHPMARQPNRQQGLAGRTTLILIHKTTTVVLPLVKV